MNRLVAYLQGRMRAFVERMELIGCVPDDEDDDLGSTHAIDVAHLERQRQ